MVLFEVRLEATQSVNRMLSLVEKVSLVVKHVSFYFWLIIFQKSTEMPFIVSSYLMIKKLINPNLLVHTFAAVTSKEKRGIFHIPFGSSRKYFFFTPTIFISWKLCVYKMWVIICSPFLFPLLWSISPQLWTEFHQSKCPLLIWPLAISNQMNTMNHNKSTPVDVSAV